MELLQPGVKPASCAVEAQSLNQWIMTGGPSLGPFNESVSSKGQFFGFWLFFNILFFSASCVSLIPETPPTALILDVPSGGSSPLLPEDPSPPADAVLGVTLKAPQVGLSRVCFL